MSRVGYAFARMRAAIEGRAVVLMYHRVATLEVDPWQMAVTPERFEAQLRWLGRSARVVPLREIAQRVRTGKSIRGLAAISFDDGYADNARIARPILARLRLPATYFVTTSVLDGKTRFWWDELEEILLRSPILPESFASEDAGEAFGFTLGEDAILDDAKRSAIAAWNADRPHPNLRTDAFLATWKVLRDLSPRRRRDALDGLRTWAGTAPATTNDAMSRAELLALAKQDGVEIGAHGVTHLALASTDPTTRGFEVGTSKSTLEELLHRRVDGFAYPNGIYDETTTHAVASAGYTHAVTTSGDPIASGSRAYELGRVHVGNWEPERLARALARAKARPYA